MDVNAFDPDIAYKKLYAELLARIQDFILLLFQTFWSVVDILEMAYYVSRCLLLWIWGPVSFIAEIISGYLTRFLHPVLAIGQAAGELVYFVGDQYPSTRSRMVWSGGFVLFLVSYCIGLYLNYLTVRYFARKAYAAVAALRHKNEDMLEKEFSKTIRKPSSVLVETAEGLLVGTAFYIADAEGMTVWATAYHVAKSGEVFRSSTGTCPCAPYYGREDLDVAFMVAPRNAGSLLGATRLKLAKSFPGVGTSMTIQVHGALLGDAEDHYLSVGVCTTLPSSSRLYHDAPSVPGCSGSPMMSGSKVVAVHVGTARPNKTQVNVAVPAAFIAYLWGMHSETSSRVARLLGYKPESHGSMNATDYAFARHVREEIEQYFNEHRIDRKSLKGRGGDMVDFYYELLEEDGEDEDDQARRVLQKMAKKHGNNFDSIATAFRDAYEMSPSQLVGAIKGYLGESRPLFSVDDYDTPSDKITGFRKVDRVYAKRFIPNLPKSSDILSYISKEVNASYVMPDTGPKSLKKGLHYNGKQPRPVKYTPKFAEIFVSKVRELYAPPYTDVTRVHNSLEETATQLICDFYATNPNGSATAYSNDGKALGTYDQVAETPGVLIPEVVEFIKASQAQFANASIQSMLDSYDVGDFNERFPLVLIGKGEAMEAVKYDERGVRLIRAEAFATKVFDTLFVKPINDNNIRAFQKQRDMVGNDENGEARSILAHHYYRHKSASGLSLCDQGLAVMRSLVLGDKTDGFIVSMDAKGMDVRTPPERWAWFYGTIAEPLSDFYRPMLFALASIHRHPVVVLHDGSAYQAEWPGGTPSGIAATNLAHTLELLSNTSLDIRAVTGDDILIWVKRFQADKLPRIFPGYEFKLESAYDVRRGIPVPNTGAVYPEANIAFCSHDLITNAYLKPLKAVMNSASGHPTLERDAALKFVLRHVPEGAHWLRLIERAGWCPQ
jgi:hypothetical protein